MNPRPTLLSPAWLLGRLNDVFTRQAGLPCCWSSGLLAVQDGTPDSIADCIRTKKSRHRLARTVETSSSCYRIRANNSNNQRIFCSTHDSNDVRKL